MRRKWRQVRRNTAYLLWLTLSPLVGVALLFVLVVFIGSTVVAGLGLLLTPLLLGVVIRRWTDLHRGLAGRVLGEHIARRYRPLPDGVGARLRHVVTDRTTWRDLGWLVTNAFAGLVAGVIGLFFAGGTLVTLFSMFFWWLKPGVSLNMLAAIPLDEWPVAIGVGLATLIVLVPLGFLVVPQVARLHARMTRAMLGRSSAEELARRVETLTETRAGVIDAHGAELRRIERDLHDGTQARLVSIAMRLGVAKQALGDDPDAVARLIDEARAGAEDAMGELPAILRTMYPPILADHGLGRRPRRGAGARRGGRLLHDRRGVDQHRETQRRQSRDRRRAPVAHPHPCHHHGQRHRRVDETRGSGVAGIRRRVAALDGTVGVDSPHGGPTTITVELPCGS